MLRFCCLHAVINHIAEHPDVHAVLTTAACCLDDRIPLITDPNSEDEDHPGPDVPLEDRDLAIEAVVDVLVGAHLLDEAGTMVFGSSALRDGKYDGELRTADGFWVRSQATHNWT